MKNSLWLLLIAPAFALAASAAQAQLYWCLDTGYSKSTGADIHDKNFSVDQIFCGDPNRTTSGKLKDVGSSYIVGSGVGMRFSPNARADIALEYRGGRSSVSTL